MWNIKFYILAVFALMLLAMPIATMAETNSELMREHQIKAAFLYNFINFVDWPKEKMPDNNEPITIGIIGNKDFIKAFDPIKDKKIRGKNIVIKYFKDLKELKKSESGNDSRRKQTIELLKKCHIVFLCTHNSKPIDNSAEIIHALKNSPVLTVGEQAGFLENGSNINFSVEKKKIRFEINLDSAKRNNLKIRSRLLKLARRVIKEKKSKDTKG